MIVRELKFAWDFLVDTWVEWLAIIMFMGILYAAALGGQWAVSNGQKVWSFIFCLLDVICFIAAFVTLELVLHRRHLRWGMPPWTPENKEY
jgi:hypothetical protein